MTFQIGYFVHDLSDPAVARRLRMFAAGGAKTHVLGFNRGADVPRLPVESVRQLGKSADARLVKRALSVLRARGGARSLARSLAGVDVLVARNLEMLAVAHAVRQAMPGRRPRLFYEVLDVHRLLVGDGLLSHLLRRVERRWLQECDGLIMSSDAFHRAHYGRYEGSRLTHLLIENKIDADIVPRAQMIVAPAGPPWRIGWFGMIRCAKSLALLDEATRRMAGRLEVDIRGRVAPTAVPDFEAVVAGNPFLEFGGEYDYRKDLPALYANVHFAWAIDMFEEGLNSSWLLPNRLYESGAFGAVALALADVEVGRWLKSRELGVLLAAPSIDKLAAALDGMTGEWLEDLRERYRASPRTTWAWDSEEAARLVAALAGAN